MHIGHEIREELRRQGRTVVWFAKQISCDRSTAYDIFNKPSMDTQQLARICKVLNCNFFVRIAQELQKDVCR